MRHETIDAPEVRRETRDVRRVSSLSSRNLVSRLTSHATAPWPKATASARCPKKLEEICLFIADCPHSTAPDEGHGFPLVRTPNVGNGRLIFEKMHRVSRAVYETRNKRAKPQAGDLIYAREAPAGNVALITKGQEVCLGQRTVLLRPNPAMADSAFLTYYLLAPEQRHRLLGTATGATVTHVNLPAIRNLEVILPPLPVQRRIADVLSAYDDLIENNRRRIAILEEAARLTYRKCFGGAEQSWVAKHGKVSDFFDVSIGRTPPRKNEECFSTESTDLKWLSIKDMRASRVFALDTTEKLTKAGIEKTHIHVSPPGTIFLSFKLTVGEVVIAADSMATNEAIAHFETDDRALRDYTYFYLSSFQYDKLGSTSAIARAINSDIVRKMDFVLPTKNILESFEKDVAPMFDQIENLTRQNVALAAARDMLLPRLMKGEVV